MKSKKNVDLKIPKITQLPSGSFTTKVMLNGQRHTITKDTEEECAAAAIAIKYKAMQIKKGERNGIKTLSDAIDEYIEAREGSASPSTLYCYRLYKKSRFLSMMQSNVYTVTDEQWQAAIKRESRGLSPKYIKNVWGMISAAVTEATGRKPKVNLPAKEQNERPYLEPDQITQFVEAVKGNTIEIAALLALSSLRRSELKALTWDCVDLNRKTITIKSAMVYSGTESGMVHKKQNKTAASNRVIPIIPPLEAALRLVEKKEGYVVPYNGSYIYERINEVCEKNGLPKVGVHGLRHSFASLAYHLQIPEKIAMEIGGWADDGTMRKIYTHLAQKDIADRAKDFTNFFTQM